MNKTSIVVVSKNDNYGGYLNTRASHALNTMINHFDEVVYVDWCSDNGSLINELDLQKTGKLKHIQVTKEDINNIAPELLQIPIVEVLGRNIGIRRASNDWIISSNIDILPDYLDVSALNENKMYAVSRRNVTLDITLNNSENDFFQFLKNNKQLFKKALKIDTHWAGRYDPWSLTVCCGDFQVAHKNLWHSMKGFEESLIYRDCADTNVLKKSVIYGNGAELLDLDVFHLDHDGHFLNVNGVSMKNDWDSSVANFERTSNIDTWGFSDYNFKEEVI